jgi:hypothetical protein
MSHHEDRENLKMMIRSTVEQRFGTAADSVRNFVEKKEIPLSIGEIIQKFIRTQGNYAIRTLEAHIDHHEVTYKKQGD